MFDVHAVRQEFPILARQVNGKPLVYLDNGASAQKPQIVIDAITQAYAQEYSNVHRGLHFLSNLATDKYESVRGVIAKFLGASNENTIIMNSGTTEGINTVAYGWAMANLVAGDEIILSVMEHHANIVPWHFLRERLGVVLKWVDIEEDGRLDEDKVIAAIGPKTKLIAITQMSNVLGTVVDTAKICAAARQAGVATLVDGSQAAVHMPVNVYEMGCDFYTITGHKLYGPSGSGALFAREERMAQMQPFLGGGDMIAEVHKETVTYNTAPMKFEAGTPAIVPMIGLGVALDYMMSLGMENIAAHEAMLCSYAAQELAKLPFVTVQGTAPGKGAIFSFTLPAPAHAHDLSTILDKSGIAVRAGQHCAGPLMEHLGLSATCRASFAMYNTREEVDSLCAALTLAHELLG